MANTRSPRRPVPAPGRAPLTGAAAACACSADDVSPRVETPRPSTIVNVLRARILEIRSQSDHRVTALLGLGEDGHGARLLKRVTQRCGTSSACVRAGGLCPGQGCRARPREEPIA